MSFSDEFGDSICKYPLRIFVSILSEILAYNFLSCLLGLCLALVSGKYWLYKEIWECSKTITDLLQSQKIFTASGVRRGILRILQAAIARRVGSGSLGSQPV